MQLSTVNNSKNMKAEDMFNENMVQVFSKKTGIYLGWIGKGMEIDFEEQEEQLQEQQEQKKESPQLQLF